MSNFNRNTVDRRWSSVLCVVHVDCRSWFPFQTSSWQCPRWNVVSDAAVFTMYCVGYEGAEEQSWEGKTESVSAGKSNWWTRLHQLL